MIIKLGEVLLRKVFIPPPPTIVSGYGMVVAVILYRAFFLLALAMFASEPFRRRQRTGEI